MVFSEHSKNEDILWIDNPSQLKQLTSPVRLAIIDSIAAMSIASISDLAKDLGLPADSLYYHVKKLVDSGLLIEKGMQETSRRDEVVYSLPKAKIRIKYDLEKVENYRLITKIFSSVLRSTSKDFELAFENPNAMVEGPKRNLWGAQLRGWLNNDEIEEVNILLNRLHEVFESAEKKEGKNLHSITWIITPLNEQPKRRAGKS